MIVEYDSLMKNNAWTLVFIPLGNNLFGCKWVYKTKFTIDK